MEPEGKRQCSPQAETEQGKKWKRKTCCLWTLLVAAQKKKRRMIVMNNEKFSIDHQSAVGDQDDIEL